MSAVTALEAPPKLQNAGRSEPQNKRGKTHLSVTKKKNGACFPTVVCLSATVIA